MLPGGVPPESAGFGAAGRPVAQVAHDLQVSAQVIYTWRRRQLTGSG